MEQLGHDGPPTEWWTENLLTGEPLERCPVRTLQLADQTLVSEMYRHVHEYYPFYQDGHLPTEGGITDQPARTLDYLKRIKTLDAQVDLKFRELQPEPLQQQEGAE